jgi:hypothetical protein
MRCKKIIFLMLAIWVIGGCGKDTNKANIDKVMYEKGKEIVKLYAQVYDGKDKVTEAQNAAAKFIEKYDIDR